MCIVREHHRRCRLRITERRIARKSRGPDLRIFRATKIRYTMIMIHVDIRHDAVELPWRRVVVIRSQLPAIILVYVNKWNGRPDENKLKPIRRNESDDIRAI